MGDTDENACNLIRVVSLNDNVWKIDAVVVATPKIRTNGSSWQWLLKEQSENIYSFVRAVAASNRYTCLRIVIRSTITAGLISSKFGMITQIFGLAESKPEYLCAYHDRSTFNVYWPRRNLMTGSSASVSISLSESSPRKLRFSSLAWRKRINISIDFICVFFWQCVNLPLRRLVYHSFGLCSGHKKPAFQLPTWYSGNLLPAKQP